MADEDGVWGIGFPLDCQNPDRTTKYVPTRASTNKGQLGIAQAVSCPQLRCHHVLQIDVLFHYGYYWSGVEGPSSTWFSQKKHWNIIRTQRLDYPPTASDHVGTNRFLVSFKLQVTEQHRPRQWPAQPIASDLCSVGCHGSGDARARCIC